MSIIGDCPYDDCDHTEWRVIPDRSLPLFSKERCLGCGKTVWVLYSRINPQVFTESGFHERYEVNEQTKHITEKDEPKS